jgi:phosphoribosyl 1,2-cyclic phosphodiesterase
MKGFCTLASGSKGNSLYFGTDKSRILVDVGLSLKILKDRLESINVPIESIQAILITHEHSDHIKGLEQIVKQYDIPIIANHDTAKELVDLLSVKPRFKLFCTGEPFSLFDLSINSFSIQHDTVDPVGFVIQSDKMKLGVCTDLGCMTTGVMQAISNMDYLVLESNHDPEMVHASSRPDVYKQRVLSKLGHLSNLDAAKTLEKVYHPGLKKVFLAHLSEECNEQGFALKTVSEYLQEKNCMMPLEVASQEKPSSFISY